MALSFNIKELKQDIFRNFRRFPLAILSSLIACVSFIISAEYDGKGEFVKYTEIGFTALLAIILFSIIDIFAESEDIEDSPFHWFSYIAGIIFLICF